MSKKINSIQLISSKVILNNLTTEIFDMLCEEEKLKIISSMCENISCQISFYYSHNLEDWDIFANKFLQK